VISFRYHLVSLAAVLLALAAGIVLGAGPLDEQLGGTSSASSSEQQAKLDALNGKVTDAQARVAYDDAAAAALAPAVLPGTLAGKTVVVVVTPGTDGAQVDELVKAVETAGGKVTGEVDVQRAWYAPDQATVLDSLTTQLLPDGQALPSGGPYVKAGSALASALVTNAAHPSTKADETSVTLLTGFEEGGFIKVSGTPAVRAQLALVVSPEQVVKGDTADAANDTLLPLVAALDSGQGAVLAGPTGSAKPGGLVAAMRSSAPVRRAVSSDDVADTASGVIATVLALTQQVGGTTGQYGVGPGADAAMPPVTPAGG
jgi:Copper transport outer membrane protein, MctB